MKILINAYACSPGMGSEPGMAWNWVSISPIFLSCIYKIDFLLIMNIFQILQKISLVPSYLWDKMWTPVWKRYMKHYGKGVYTRPMSSDFKGLWNLSV